MARWWLVVSVAAWCCAVSAVVAQAPPAASPLQAKCQDDFGKLTDCMDYATGHAGTPSSTCCSDADATHRSRPECLCYIIQQVHSGRQEVQSLGLRFDRLLALPSACKLANANVTLCISEYHSSPRSLSLSLSLSWCLAILPYWGNSRIAILRVPSLLIEIRMDTCVAIMPEFNQ
jgi:hypothetical protein